MPNKIKLRSPHRLPSFYQITFYGNDTVPFGEIYWSLAAARDAVRDDVLANWEGDIPYDTAKWHKIAPGRWSYYAGDSVYEVFKVQPEAES